MSAPIRPHGTGIRGFTLASKSKTFSGRFGRIFRALPPAEFGSDDTATEAALEVLGQAMVAEEDPPKDGPDAEESAIPAVYTYFGQFIDHDLTFDPASALQRQNDPDALIDFRTPRFDLDSVYGRGPDDQPYLYADGRIFLLGRDLTGQALGRPVIANDLPRSQAKTPDAPDRLARAIIGDPRNDENVIVSQLQGLILKLHNTLADQHPGWSFPRVQQEVRFHYQWVVLHDFLPTIVSHHVLHPILPHLANQTDPLRDKPRLQFYSPRHDPFMPLEFSAAAYRFGHSMVRPGYRLNDDVSPLPIFPFFDDPEAPALTGFDEFPDSWAIDWARFADLEPRPYGREPDPTNPVVDPDNTKRTQRAYRIDTSLVNPLGHLPARVASDPPPSLASRNLLRGWRMRLPSGQDVARAMGLPVRPDSEILIGKFTGDATDVQPLLTATAAAGDAFKDNCPLWTYVLAETEEVTLEVHTTNGVQPISTRRLGPVGGTIVAETIVGLLAADSTSFLNVDPLWTPSLAVDGQFTLANLIDAALHG